MTDSTRPIPDWLKPASDCMRPIIADCMSIKIQDCMRPIPDCTRRMRHVFKIVTKDIIDGMKLHMHCKYSCYISESS